MKDIKTQNRCINLYNNNNNNIVNGLNPGVSVVRVV